MSAIQSSTLSDSAKQPAFDAVAAGAEIDREYERWQQARKLAKRNIEVQRSIKRNFIKLLQHAHHNAPNFKEFVEKHTHVVRSTAYRLLGIEDGRGDEIREKERERQDRHRPPVSVTKPVTDTRKGNDHDPDETAAERKAAYGVKPKSAPAPKSAGTGPKRGSPEWGLAEAERFDKDVLAVVGRDVAEGILKFLRDKCDGRTRSHLKLVG